MLSFFLNKMLEEMTSEHIHTTKLVDTMNKKVVDRDWGWGRKRLANRYKCSLQEEYDLERPRWVLGDTIQMHWPSI